jgi:hypothetical protein
VIAGEFDILAHGFLRLCCGDCGHDKLVALSRNETARWCLK